MHLPKILLVAPYIDHNDVGESRSNYHWVKGISANAEVTLLSSHLPGHPTVQEQFPELRVVEWQDPNWSTRAPRLAAMLKPGYMRFCSRATSWIRSALDRGEQFDLAHQISPLAIRYSSPLRNFDVPYVIGPVGGSLDTPSGFVGKLGEAWFVKLRRLDRLRLRYDPWLRSTYERAEIVLGVAPYVQDYIRGYVGVNRFEAISETGLERLPDYRVRSSDSSSQTAIRLLYVGRLVRSKGLYFALEALSRIRHRHSVHLDVAGKGPDEISCRDLVERESLNELVTFHGQVPMEKVWELYRQSDIFVFPSIREPSGNVILEAMSHGLPVISTNNGGPGHVITDQCGVRCVARNPSGLVDELVTAIDRLASNADLRHALGVAARARVQENYLWPRKIEWIFHRYEELLCRGNGRGM